MHSTLTRRTILALAGTAATLASPLVMAHIGTDGAPHLHQGDILSSLGAGALHPLTGLDHLAAMVSVGIWSALSTAPDAGRQRLLAAPLAFAGALLAGALLGMGGLHVPAVEAMIAASLLVLGLLTASRLKLGTGAGAALVAVFALFHGVAHGAELGGHALAALSGMVASTAALHGLGMALGLALRDPRQRASRWASRAAGVGVAAMGLSMLTPALASAL